MPMPPVKTAGAMALPKRFWTLYADIDATPKNNVTALLRSYVSALDHSRAAQNMVLDNALGKGLALVHQLASASKSQNDTERRESREKMFYAFKDMEHVLENERPSAVSWHDSRRRRILKQHPEVAELLGDDILTPIMMVILVLGHLCLALSLQLLPSGYTFLVTFAASAFCGGFCAFGFQALNHELSHTTGTPFAWTLSLAGSSCTAVPWFSYYFSGGHAKHHRKVGTPKDVDRDAFFWAWERTPAMLDSAWGSFIWASVVALFLPALYMYSLSVAILASWQRNIKELTYFLAELLCTVALHAFIGYHGGPEAVLYLVLSMAFGNGFLLHPLMGFWILQHLCTSRSLDEKSMSLQPTVSYVGSPLWNLLNFNCLSHVEHHDFSRIPWTRIPCLTELAPEFYASPDMYTCKSIVELIQTWVMTKGDKFHFACLQEQVPATKSD